MDCIEDLVDNWSTGQDWRHYRMARCMAQKLQPMFPTAPCHPHSTGGHGSQPAGVGLHGASTRSHGHPSACRHPDLLDRTEAPTDTNGGHHQEIFAEGLLGNLLVLAKEEVQQAYLVGGGTVRSIVVAGVHRTWAQSMRTRKLSIRLSQYPCKRGTRICGVVSLPGGCDPTFWHQLLILKGNVYLPNKAVMQSFSSAP